MMAATTPDRPGAHGSKFLAWAVFGLTLLALSACGSIEPRPDSAEVGKNISGAADSASTSTNASAYQGIGVAAPSEFSRGANLTAGLIGSMLQTYSTDPFVRPVNTVRSLGFLVKNSVSDFSKRVYINTVRLPAIKGSPIPPLSNEPGMNLEEWEQQLDRLTGAKSSTGTLDFLLDGEQFFPALIQQIEAAERSIQLRTYIFDNDDYAVQIADLLKSRSQELEITVLMDGIGSLAGASVYPASMPATHVPPTSIARYLETESRVKARMLTNPWFTGDHCKVAIFDRKIAFLGGMNIGREYRYEWHDLMVRVEGPVVDDLARDADKAWARSGMWGELAGLFRAKRGSNQFPSDSSYPVRILYTEIGRSQIYNAKIAAIRRARQYIYIENPYFSDDVILYELIKARRRGVDVRFIISERGDMPLMDMSNSEAINELLANGVRVYVYPGMAHSKAAIIDGWLTVGSANLDHLSMRVNNEVNVATSHPQAVQALKERLFERDFEISRELEQPLPTRLTHWLAEAWADVFM